MKKTMLIGTGNEGRIFVTVKYENNNFSLSGVIRPTRHGNATSAGQIKPVPTQLKYADGWDSDKISSLNKIWAKYHLNDMQAGTPEQTALVNDFLLTNNYDYDQVCNFLQLQDMLFDGDYKYGSSWLSIDVPGHIIAWFEQFTDATDLLPIAWQ